MRRMILVPVLIFLALAAIGGGITYWVYDSYTFYRTDDAQLTSKIINVSAPAAGTLSALNVKLGDTVTQGQTIGTITGAPTVGANGVAGNAPSVSITSPLSGTILQVPTVQGQLVSPGVPVVTLTDLNSLLPNQDPTSSNFTKVGQRVPILISLDGNGGKDILPGMSVSVTIHLH